MAEAITPSRPTVRGFKGASWSNPQARAAYRPEAVECIAEEVGREGHNYGMICSLRPYRDDMPK